MKASFEMAWRQLSYHRVKLVVAAMGVVVAVMLMLVQLGIRQGVLENSVAIARRISADLVVISPRTQTIFQSTQFPRRLLFRLPAHPAVERVQEVYIGVGRWRNPWSYIEHPISVYGIDPRTPLLKLPGFSDRADDLLLLDHILFDQLNRKNFGPVAKFLEENPQLDTEVNNRRIKVIGAIRVGISVTTDGNLFTAPANFHRLFRHRSAGAVDVGLVQLKPGVSSEAVKKSLQEQLGAEAKIMTRAELIASEEAFIRENVPIDFIFGMGATIGFFIGFVVVYQILYTEVTNHLPQFATLKAMGFTDAYLLRIVLAQALLLSIMGYFPGFLLSLGVYDIATTAIQMPFRMTVSRAISVFALTLTMCGFSAIVAIQKARTADPADVF